MRDVFAEYAALCRKLDSKSRQLEAAFARAEGVHSTLGDIGSGGGASDVADLLLSLVAEAEEVVGMVQEAEARRVSLSECMDMLPLHESDILNEAFAMTCTDLRPPTWTALASALGVTDKTAKAWYVEAMGDLVAMMARHRCLW